VRSHDLSLGIPLQLTGVASDHHKQADDAVPSIKILKIQKTNRNHIYFVLISEWFIYYCHRKKKKTMSSLSFQGSKNLPLPAVKGAARKPQESNRCTPVVEGCRFLPTVYTVGPRRLFDVSRKRQELMNPYFLSLQ
jgi:hypothetical protein